VTPAKSEDVAANDGHPVRIRLEQMAGKFGGLGVDVQAVEMQPGIGMSDEVPSLIPNRRSVLIRDRSALQRSQAVGRNAACDCERPGRPDGTEITSRFSAHPPLERPDSERIASSVPKLSHVAAFKLACFNAPRDQMEPLIQFVIFGLLWAAFRGKRTHERAMSA
jgi:hypothetical protein